MARDVAHQADQILNDYVSKHRRSQALDLRAQEVLPGGDTRSTAFYPPFPLYVAEGKGCTFRDVDGNTYFDFLNNYTSMVVGHCHPKVVSAVQEYLGRGQAFATGLEVQIALAEELCRRVSTIERIRFCNSGSEATMFAIRAARAWTGRDKIVKIEGGYHGSHDGVAISTKPVADKWGPHDSPTALPAGRGIPASALGDVFVVPFNDLEVMENVLKHNNHEIAAVVMEPFLGAGGVIPPADGYLSGVRQQCDKYGVLLVLDEIQSLRLAPGGAQELYGVRADLTALGKIIGGGYPVGAFGGRADIMGVFSPRGSKPVPHAGTFNGNVATMVAGLATMQLLTAEECRRLNALGDRLREGLQTILNRADITGTVTQAGSILNLHFVKGPIVEYRDAARADASMVHLVHLALINRGVFTARRGAFNISTPMTEKEIDFAVAAFEQVLMELTVRRD